MKLSTIFILSLLISNWTCIAQKTASDGIQGGIKDWQEQQAVGGDVPTPMLRVIYFHGNDMEPLANYRDRLTRVMDDISDFYRDGMRANGFDSEGLPLEKDEDGKLILHVVKGQHEAAHYTYDSGDETEAEMRKSLAGKIDFDREFVLALYGQSWKMEGGRHGALW